MTLSYQSILGLISREEVTGVLPDQVQSASFDLKLTDEIYRMPGSILPGKQQTVNDLVEQRAIYKVTRNQPLELGCYYLCKTKTTLKLPKNVYGDANNKSSSGRINLQGRLVLDKSEHYDHIPMGYNGEVWIELHPKLCLIQLDFEHGAVNQIRLKQQSSTKCLEGDQIISLHEKTPVLYHPNGSALTTKELRFSQDGRALLVGVDLPSTGLAGYQGRPRQDIVLDLKSKENDPTLLFHPIYCDGSLWMRREEFFIISSQERVCNPPDVCITMLPYQAEHGEFRSHFAGFFDPGNGYGKYGEEKGFSVTMEVIPMEDAIEIRSGKPMFSIQIDVMDETPEKLYGVDYSSNYFCNPGPKLAKFFKPWPY